MPRSILITGCSSGIGQCAALGMQARGWQVFATARKPADIEALKRDRRHRALSRLHRDRTRSRRRSRAVFAATGGTLDALFNNGAYGQPGALEDVTTDVLRAQFEANFFGWHDLTRRVIPAMRRQGHGRIVMCSSVLGIITMGFRGPYSRTKFALEGLFRHAADRACRLRHPRLGRSSRARSARALRQTRSPMRARTSTSNIPSTRPPTAAGSARWRRAATPSASSGRKRCSTALVKACESNNPRPQYFVTMPTYGMSLLEAHRAEAAAARVPDLGDRARELRRTSTP